MATILSVCVNVENTLSNLNLNAFAQLDDICCQHDKIARSIHNSTTC